MPINHCLSFRERDQMLTPPSDWGSERGRHLWLLGLPATAEPFLDRLTGNLKAGLAALEEAREAGRVTIGRDGALHLSAFDALPTDGIPRRTRDLLFKAICPAQFADLMMEVDHWCATALARRAKSHLSLGAAPVPGYVDAPGVRTLQARCEAPAAVGCLGTLVEMKSISFSVKSP